MLLDAKSGHHGSFSFFEKLPSRFPLAG
jgi:hypothetical protein